ncbi:MAG: DUF3187 family protein, partial [bacterium]|nr:DUF3187 family protein [bacterium]
MFSFFFFLIFSLFCTQGFAASFSGLGPVPIRNQNPLALQSLNMRPQGATVLPNRKFEVEMDLAYSSIFERHFIAAPNLQTPHPTTGYQLALDMELLRQAFFFHYGFLDRYEVGMEIPFISMTGGFLDSFTEGFHQAFGFPNGGRQYFDKGLFAYSIQQNGTTVYQVNQQDYGLSDIVFDFKHQILIEKKYLPALASVFYFKIPTGSSGNGFGSGNPDFGFQLALEKNYHRYHGYLNLAYLVVGGNDQLSSISNHYLFSWMTAFEMNLVREALSGIIQISGDTPLFDQTGISTMDNGALNLTVGFAGKVWEQHQWKIAFEEDLDPTSSAMDFTAWLQWSYR